MPSDAQADAPTLVPPPVRPAADAAKEVDAKPLAGVELPVVDAAAEIPKKNGSQNGNGHTVSLDAVTVIDIPRPSSSASKPVPVPVSDPPAPPPTPAVVPAARPLLPEVDSPFAPSSAPTDGIPMASIASGGAVASASHLPALPGLSGTMPPPSSASGQLNRIPPTYMPLASGIIPMPSGMAWQKVNAQIPAAPPQAVLIATGLRKKFGKREVVRGVEIEVGAGEIVGLLGRNGAGKTTTFRMIMGLLHPDQGKVMYENRDISRIPMYERANRGIGYLAQQPSIFQRLTVEENLLAILELQERDKKKRYERLEALIADLGLNTVRKSMASVLSGGERRRLEIARAMSLRPRVVLFDEPFAGIDPIAVSEIQGILRDLKSQGVGVLLTDHNVRETLTITDRTYIMDEGTIWIHGPPREIVANPDARARYLGHDFRLDF